MFRFIGAVLLLLAAAVMRRGDLEPYQAAAPEKKEAERERAEAEKGFAIFQPQGAEHDLPQ